MAISEFGLIERFFARFSNVNSNVRLGIGDDCALLSIPDGYELAVTTDTMVENIHFFAGADPKKLGHKLLAVNLSDLASMAAQPIAATLALTLPEVNEDWLYAFSSGFFQLANKYSVELVGGDTTSGPLTMTLQAMGLVPEGQSLKRSLACSGDLVYITGNLGNAGLGLKIEQGYKSTDDNSMTHQLNQPEPRVYAGLSLRTFATACIDVSDGLVSDLGHILQASKVGACLDWNKLPLSSAVIDYIETTGDWEMPLTAGDDYELCFTLPQEKKNNFEHLLASVDCACTMIGRIETRTGLRLYKDNKTEVIKTKGFEHF